MIPISLSASRQKSSRPSVATYTKITANVVPILQYSADPFVGPREVMDVFTKKIIYKSRTDAVADACGVQLLKPMALKLLSAPGDEIDRLKREYQPCDPN